MADEELDLLDDVEMLEGEEDNARDLTSGIVFATTGALVIALFIMEKALAAWFNVGPFANT
ncbi:MAG: hypothetical protein CL910_11430 [Deltaproteobacteria bacterium]|nr:hypothetical protein [Deltaproteobacteria bacterium]